MIDWNLVRKLSDKNVLKNANFKLCKMMKQWMQWGLKKYRIIVSKLYMKRFRLCLETRILGLVSLWNCVDSSEYRYHNFFSSYNKKNWVQSLLHLKVLDIDHLNTETVENRGSDIKREGKKREYKKKVNQ